LLDALAEESDHAVLVNTSMNGAGDPIASTAASVLSFFLRHRVDALAVDDLLIERPHREAP
jgi:predicted NodU family carbamoyl transferase